MAEEIVYTAQEAAKAAKVSMPTFYNWTRQDDFPAMRVGRKWLIPVEPFKKWLSAKAVSGRW